jgi:uncharacterized membrane protein YfcA
MASVDIPLNLATILTLVMIGAIAGILSGFVGIGGGVVIVPALIFFFGLSQVAAQGTSLMLMLPPIGALAVMNYWKEGVADLRMAGIMAVAFVIGGYFGSKLALQLPPAKVKLGFGIFMLYVSLRMIYTGIKTSTWS